MNVVVNGETKSVEGGITVKTVVDTLSRSPLGIAVSVNRQIVPKSQWDNSELHHGDQVEVLTVSAGG